MQAAVNTKSVANNAAQGITGIAALAPVVGRILVAAIFLWSGIGKIVNFAGTAGYMASMGIPLTQLALVITIVIEVGAALMLIFGWKARLAAGALLLWMIPVTLIFHAFWAATPDQAQMQMIQFFKNVSIMGAMLLIVGFGSGPYSLDRRR
jgi:putative oxidoreductase